MWILETWMNYFSHWPSSQRKFASWVSWVASKKAASSLAALSHPTFPYNVFSCQKVKKPCLTVPVSIYSPPQLRESLALNAPELIEARLRQEIEAGNLKAAHFISTFIIPISNKKSTNSSLFKYSGGSHFCTVWKTRGRPTNNILDNLFIDQLSNYLLKKSFRHESS